MTYRPSGRSNRSGRSQAENDVFEGLPVKQWGKSYTRVSLAPPAPETTKAVDDRWGEIPLPRDSLQLSPWTQQLLRIARNGKYGMKRKRDPEHPDVPGSDDDEAESTSKLDSENRGYVIQKWKHVPDSQLEPEHKHFEFLAGRRKGLPSMYGPDALDIASIPTRRTKVKRTNAQGLVFVYEVLVGEGQSIDGEIPSTLPEAELAALPASLTLGPGTVIEGLGVANDDGIVVVDQLRPLAAPRRSKSSTKKKGGPGRGKKRVTFTNPDGSTYTTVVPNATKIVPQPGQTVKHVAKGEIAMADISKEEAARLAAERGATTPGDDGDEGDDGEDDDDDDDGEDDEDDDEREDGEVSDDDNSVHGSKTASTGPVESAVETPLSKADIAVVELETSTVPITVDGAANGVATDTLDTIATEPREEKEEEDVTDDVTTENAVSNVYPEDTVMEDDVPIEAPSEDLKESVDFAPTVPLATAREETTVEPAANTNDDTIEAMSVPLDTSVSALVAPLSDEPPPLPSTVPSISDEPSQPPVTVLPTLQPAVDVAPPSAEIIAPDATAMVEVISPPQPVPAIAKPIIQPVVLDPPITPAVPATQSVTENMPDVTAAPSVADVVDGASGDSNMD